MRQIKEKAPATPASVTSANLNNQVKDTTKKLIRQAECASEVSQTYPAKATYQISEYLEYCDYVGKQPDKSIIEFIESNSGTPRYPREKREEIESELMKTVATLTPAYLDRVIEFARFLKWRNKRNNT